MSDRTSRLMQCPISSGPLNPAPSTAKRCPSTRRAPSSGSTPSRAHARSANERPGTISSVISPRSAASRSSVTVRSATAGFPGTP